MRRTSFLLFTLLAAGFSTADVQACTCAGHQTGDAAYSRSAAVFLGEVIEIRPVRFRDLTEGELLERSRGAAGKAPEDLATYYHVRFLVEEGWKGLSGLQEVVVGTSMESASCGFPFRVGKRFVVFAFRSQGLLRASICSATAEAEESASMLRYLRRKARGDFRSLLAGRIGWESDDPEGMVSDAVGQKLPVTLSLQGPGIQRRIRPQSGGRFEFDDLPPGAYTLRLELPSDYDPDPFEYRVELADPIDFADLDVGPPNLPAGGISLSIRDAAGRALPTMSVLLNDSKDSAYIENGLLRAKHLRAGQYWLAFPVDGSSSANLLFYPEGRSADEAEMIEVKAGQITRLPEWRLPFEIEPALLEGVVLLPDGRPAAEAVVALNADMLHFWTKADRDGRFQLPYYLPFRYHLEASAKDPDQGRSHRLEPLPWPPQELPSDGVRLILQ